MRSERMLEDSTIENTAPNLQASEERGHMTAGRSKESEQAMKGDVVLKVKRWRVGSLSMGVSLLLSGILLLLSQFKGTEVWDVALHWWPMIFILLGLEIILYLVMARAGNDRIHYDVFSILFVGCLGMVCLVLASLSSLGLTQEIRQIISAEEQTIQLPEVSATLDPHIERIVIQTGRSELAMIDYTSERALHIVGSYRMHGSSDSGESYVHEAIHTKKVGEVLYVFVTDPPQKEMFQTGRNRVQLSIMAPQDIEMEVRDAWGNPLNE